MNQHNRAIGLSASLRWRIFARDNFSCRYCGATPPDVILQVDHVTARSNGGTDDESNLVAACQSCNTGKGVRVLEPMPTKQAATAGVQIMEAVIGCHEEFPQVMALLLDHAGQQAARLETRKVTLNAAVFCLMVAGIRLGAYLWLRAPFGDKSKREFMRLCAAQFDEEAKDG